MTTTIIHCDKCGERIEIDRSLMSVDCGPLRYQRQTVDLCPKCAQAFGAWLADKEAKGEGEHGDGDD